MFNDKIQKKIMEVLFEDYFVFNYSQHIVSCIDMSIFINDTIKYNSFYELTIVNYQSFTRKLFKMFYELEIELSCLICLIIYLKRLKKLGYQIHKYNITKIIIILGLLSIKNHDDFLPCSKDFIKACYQYKMLSGCDYAYNRIKPQYNMVYPLEIELLTFINWDLSISSEEYNQNLKELLDDQ
jgi:hypothetical protein